MYNIAHMVFSTIHLRTDCIRLFSASRLLWQLGIAVDFQTEAFHIIIFKNNLVIHTKLLPADVYRLYRRQFVLDADPL